MHRLAWEAMTTFADILSGAAAGAGVVGTAAAAVGGTTIAAAATTVAAAAGLGAVSATGVGAIAVGVGAAVAGLISLIESDGDDADVRGPFGPQKAPVPMVNTRDACGPRRIALWRAVGDYDARLGWESQPHPIPTQKARDLVYAIRRMREDGLARSEIHRWVSAWCQSEGSALGVANANVQAGIAQRIESQALASPGSGPFALIYTRLINAGCARSAAIKVAKARDTADALSPMGAATLARRGAMLDPTAWECRERAIRARFPMPGGKRSIAVTGGNVSRPGGSKMFMRTATPTYQPTSKLLTFQQANFTGYGEKRALDPREASTTQLAIGAGGGAVGALVGYKIGKKKGGAKGAKKWAILAGVAGALAGYFGANAAGV